MNWTQVDSMQELFAFGAGRPIIRESTVSDPQLCSHDDVLRIAYFSDGSAIAVVTEIEIRGPYSEVTPDVDVLAQIRCFIGKP